VRNLVLGWDKVAEVMVGRRKPANDDFKSTAAPMPYCDPRPTEVLIRLPHPTRLYKQFPQVEWHQMHKSPFWVDKIVSPMGGNLGPKDNTS
jgi:hypothetical protein